jgi:hypothetical protein
VAGKILPAIRTTDAWTLPIDDFADVPPSIAWAKVTSDEAFACDVTW